MESRFGKDFAGSRGNGGCNGSGERTRRADQLGGSVGWIRRGAKGASRAIRDASFGGDPYCEVPAGAGSDFPPLPESDFDLGSFAEGAGGLSGDSSDDGVR